MIEALMLAAQLMWPSPLEPKVGASCYGSPIALGTSNIPVSNGKATSVVNMWAALVSNQSEPILWVYENYSGQFFARTNLKMKSYVVQMFSTDMAKELLAQNSEAGPPLRLKSKDDLNREFARVGAALHPCFLKPLPSRFVADPTQTP